MSFEDPAVAARAALSVETVVPGAGGDGAVYMAANQNTVYAIWPRYNVVVGNPMMPDLRGDLVMRRDDAGGANNFTNLFMSIPPASGVVFPFQTTMLGSNRLNSSFGIAVDPNNAMKVFVAWTDVNPAGAPQVHVARSLNAGMAWAVQRDLPANTGLPALAVANNGTAGLLYTRLTAAGNLETHFVQSRDDFRTIAGPDAVIATFPNGMPPVGPQPYIGDYEGLVAVGNRFYGTFAASNEPVPFPLPAGRVLPAVCEHKWGRQG